ncbi:MAG: response regulator [Gemmatimonadetes bacterium]|nr:response regulator [Gemmatimonadota bacterium]
MIDTAAPTAFLGQHASEVWTRSRDRHLERVEVLERAVLALMDGDLDETLRELAETEAHSLAGSVGTFGLRTGSRLARALEQTFAARHTLERGLAARLADQVLALRRELERPVLAEALSPDGEAPRRVMLVSDGARGDLFITEGVAAGLEVVVRPVGAAIEALGEEVPDAIILDWGDAPIERATFLLDTLARRAPGPVVVIAPNDGMALRLAIARAGAIGPLQPGLPPAVSLERVQALLAARTRPPASVLVVDIDPFTAQLATLVLEQAGHRVHALTDPERYWETLETVAPDLIVSGVSLGAFTGTELCRALRADPRWRELPVIFVAAPTDATLVREAYRSGGDDVLRKPLVREELVARVENRLQRARLLRRHGDTHPLTGLTGRSKAERDIDRFLRLGRRHGHPVTLAVFRLDRFGQQLGRVGQATLDAATLSFSQLLVQSFRTEDVVSQWGPNEFVVGLFDATAENATVRVHEVMAAMRTREFASFSGERITFTCSAGLATFPSDGGDVRELHAAADAALVLAGRSGNEECLGVASAPHLRSGGHVDVLILDEDAAVASVLLHALESRQHQVRWIRDGQEAADALLGDRPEVRARLILLEVNLPGLNGLSLLRSLAAQDMLRHTRVIVLSARSTEAETVQAFELGAFDYVPKPFSVAVLTERVRRALHA